MALAPSISASLGGRSLGQKSKATMTTTSAKVTQSQKSHHDGDRFKSKKKNTGVHDTKEPTVSQSLFAAFMAAKLHVNHPSC